MNSKRIFTIAGIALALMLVFALGVAAGSQTTPAAADAPTEQAGDEQGIVIVSVAADGPAAAAGVKRGNILLTLDDQAIDSARDLRQALADLEPGDEASLTVLHGDEQRTLTVTLGEQNDRAYLGVTPCGDAFHAIPDAIPDLVMTPGAVIVEVVADSPADQAGLRQGERIVAVDGEELTGTQSLGDIIAGHQPGDTVTLTVEGDDGEEPREVAVTLGEHPDEAGKAYLGVRYAPFLDIRSFGRGDVPFAPDFGDAIPIPLPNVEGATSGVVVTGVAEGSAAETAGLKKGDVITEIDGEPVESPNTVREAIAAHQPGDTITLSVFRSGEEEAMSIQATLGASPDNEGQAYLGVTLGGFFRLFDSDEGPRDWPGPRFEFRWPKDIFPFEGCPCPETTPAEPETAPNTSTTL
jgi:S1-C subfamily serine protease